jgi:hypothetical protein
MKAANYPFSVVRDEFKSKRVPVTGGSTSQSYPCEPEPARHLHAARAHFARGGNYLSDDPGK